MLATTTFPTSAPCVVVSALIPGHLYLLHKEIFQDALESGVETGAIVPTFSFLIEHSTKGKSLFDFGLRKPECEKDVSDILTENNVDPYEIQGIIFSSLVNKRCFMHSHLHFDHIGDVQICPSAEIILASEAESLFEKPTYPTDHVSPFNEWPEGRCELYQIQRKSLLLIDAPGHFLGHLAALSRVGLAPMDIEGSTTAKLDRKHNSSNYSETCSIRQISEENHEDIGVSRATMASLIRVAEDLPNIVIILAHEKDYEGEGMPIVPAPLNGWAMDRVRRRTHVLNQSISEQSRVCAGLFSYFSFTK
ncbi:hypothetical protein J3R30DRAFT_3412411 [Lentinula aciculospora]|uniref:Metallo-beta-lactamase domain-containing protein n=1 Tax=Lentinula aciculospora TaxID=153920 RepID=A0A9W8ZTA8_9AGAR|nr:hypothetical protein J3R30DRAFT_3412411 [Lentinula aciculospora]